MMELKPISVERLMIALPSAQEEFIMIFLNFHGNTVTKLIRVINNKVQQRIDEYTWAEWFSSLEAFRTVINRMKDYTIYRHIRKVP